MTLSSITREIAERILGERDIIVEMANLTGLTTGLKGTVYISSRQGSHGARVKYHPEGRAGKSPYWSISVGPSPKVVASSKELAGTKPEADVFNWIMVNHETLQSFWDDGYSWTNEEVQVFISNLKKI